MYPLDTFRAQGEDRVTGLRVARWNFTSLLVGLTLKRELHNQTRQLQEDMDEGLYHSSTGVHFSQVTSNSKIWGAKIP